MLNKYQLCTPLKIFIPKRFRKTTKNYVPLDKIYIGCRISPFLFQKSIKNEKQLDIQNVVLAIKCQSVFFFLSKVKIVGKKFVCVSYFSLCSEETPTLRGTKFGAKIPLYM